MDSEFLYVGLTLAEWSKEKTLDDMKKDFICVLLKTLFIQSAQSKIVKNQRGVSAYSVIVSEVFLNTSNLFYE